MNRKQAERAIEDLADVLDRLEVAVFDTAAEAWKLSALVTDLGEAARKLEGHADRLVNKRGTNDGE